MFGVSTRTKLSLGFSTLNPYKLLKFWQESHGFAISSLPCQLGNGQMYSKKLLWTTEWKPLTWNQFSNCFATCHVTENGPKRPFPDFQVPDRNTPITSVRLWVATVSGPKLANPVVFVRYHFRSYAPPAANFMFAYNSKTVGYTLKQYIACKYDTLADCWPDFGLRRPLANGFAKVLQKC
jgi:hypothetical protein